MKKFQALAQNIDNFNAYIGKISASLILLMVLLSFVITFMRYFLNVGSIFLQESIIYMHGANFFLSGAFALKQNAHVRVDIYYSKMTNPKKALVNIFGSLLLLIPSMIFCFYVSFSYVTDSWKYLEGSKEAGGINAVFILKSIIIIAPTLLILQAIADIIRNVLFLKGFAEYPQNKQIPHS